jgi:hypothetical protein
MAVIYRTSEKVEPSRDKRADFPAPLVMREISEYRSPIDGKPITSRTERNEDCSRNDAIPWEPGIGSKAGAKERTPGFYRNPKFAKKRNLPLHESVKDKS